MEAVKEVRRQKKKKSKNVNAPAISSESNQEGLACVATTVDDDKSKVVTENEIEIESNNRIVIDNEAIRSEIEAAISEGNKVPNEIQILPENKSDVGETIQNEVVEIVAIQSEHKAVENNLVASVDKSREQVGELNDSKSYEQDDVYKKTLEENRRIISTIQLSEISILEAKETKQGIRAYTESQLEALYCNKELEELDNFAAQFVEAELRGIAVKRHPLYELLESYLHVRNKITGNNLEVSQLKEEYRQTTDNLWTLKAVTVNGRGECQDGNTVTISHSYNKAIFNQSVFKTVDRILTSLRKTLTETHALYSYSAEVYRLQIELFLQNLTSNISLPLPNAPVVLLTQSPPPHLFPVLNELRLCISVLFTFQRRVIRDTRFIQETRDWLRCLVATLLRFANWQDHLFIINHILRCPAGVASWASGFVQLPLSDGFHESPFASYEINHLISVMAMILMPIQKREEFLEQIFQSRDNSTDTPWVIVDSDGEEDEESPGTSLRENDLVQLFNQLPVDNLFRAVMLIRHQDNKDFYDSTQVTESHLLRFFAFSTVLLKILRRGLQTYNQPRYNQFSKRLCRFIRHVVQYATDQWEHFKTNQRLEDTAMLKRLEVEYDAFFLRATHYLYCSQKMGAWQFLAVVPYHVVSIKTLWRIFYLLHENDTEAEVILDPTDGTDYKENIWDKSLRSAFEDKLCTIADAESYYLLNTFANMALARKEDDMEFIHDSVMDLLQIGFISETTQEMCSKNARILLAHLTSRHPQLISDILVCVKKNLFTMGDQSLYLFEDLPLSIWKMQSGDIDTISAWLSQNPITSVESKLSRMILSRLNWDIGEDRQLFLPYCTHFRVATLLVEVVEQEPGYLSWAWQMVFRLRLHVTDKGFTDLTRIVELENLNVVSKGVREQQPLSCLLALLMTSWGHLVPLVCSKGLELLAILEQQQKYDALLFALYLIVPMFLNCQESLINCDSYQAALQVLLNADRGYVNLAKSLVAPQNVVLEQFGNMIEYQVVNYRWYDLNSPRCLVRLWMNSLVSVPNWNSDFGVLYLLDIIIRSAFTHVDALQTIVEILRELLQNVSSQGHSSPFSSLFKWATSSATSPQGSLLTMSSLPSCVWLAYVLIGLEHEEREKQTGLWNEILNQLKKQKGKVNVDSCIKKAAHIVKVPSFTSSSLCIYRWAQQALDTPIDHPVLPLLWQKFFTLYLVRLPVSSASEKGCIGEKFFEGILNMTFFKRLKRRLQQTTEYYQKKTEDCDESEIRRIFYDGVYRIFRAYSLWLEEPRLHESGLYLPGLPTHYEPQLLGFIFQQSTAPWIEYVDYETMRTDSEKNQKLWRCAIYREKKNRNQPLANSGHRAESTDPVERILKRLQSYDAPKPPPPFLKLAPILPPLNFTDTSSMFNALRPHFDTLKQFASNHNLRVSEHVHLDSTYRDLVPQLYRSVTCKLKKSAHCKGLGHNACTGAATLLFEVQEARLNENVEHQIGLNRSEYESLLNKSLQSPARPLCNATVALQKVVDVLQVQSQTHKCYAEMGVELFYFILTLINEESNAYPPTRQFFTQCLERLGQAFICGVEYETPRLLNKILAEPKFVGVLAPHFSPINMGTVNFLHMYSTICSEVGQKYDIVFALLSKFDVQQWLVLKQPKLNQRADFINLISKALTTLNYEPPPESLVLHEMYRTHLLCIFEHQFPEHYGDVLTMLLKSSNSGADAGCVAANVWMDVLNWLSKPLKFRLGLTPRELLRQYAQHQRLLRYQELLETTTLLASHFSNERLQYGLYGLYPKYRNYMEVFVHLLGMTGHALVISALNTHRDVLDDKLCEKIWPLLRDMFAPWVVPYWIHNMKDNMASWMQQLTDDRAVLLPWIAADLNFAQKVVQMMFDCVQFIINTLPASNSILSFVWHWYVTNFAHPNVKEHVLNVIHTTFLALPWNKFCPTIVDLELMFRVVDQYLPECHMFLGHVFMEVSWPNFLNHAMAMQLKIRAHQWLLHLLVKLTAEPNIRSKHGDKAKMLVAQATLFDWNVLEPVAYQNVMDWYITSCDSLVIFKCDQQQLDFLVLQLLKTVAHFDKPPDETEKNTLHKRHIYVRSYVKLTSVLATRHKSLLSTKENEFVATVLSFLNHVETVVKDKDEFDVILAEVFGLLNISGISRPATKAFEQWISPKASDSIILAGVLRNVAVSVTNNEVVAVLMEAAINSYFANASDCINASWENAPSVGTFAPRLNELEQVLVSSGKILSLHALLLKKSQNSADPVALINTILQWLSNIKIVPGMDDKIPLLWSQVLKLTLPHCEANEPEGAAILHNFAQILLQNCSEKGISGWGKGLLGVIGIVKHDAASLKFRFLSKALASYVLAQLPDTKGEPQTVRYVANAPATVGNPGGNTECVKLMLQLDFGQTQGEIKTCAELALKQIQNPANSLHSARKFLSTMLTQMYVKPYLKDIDKC